MRKANNIERLSHWFTYPRIHLPVWVPTDPDRMLFAKLTGNVYQQWAIDKSSTWQVTDLPIGVTRAFPTSDGLYAWFFSFVNGDNGVWVRQDLFEATNLEIPVSQLIGALRGAVSSKGGSARIQVSMSGLALRINFSASKATLARSYAGLRFF